MTWPLFKYFKLLATFTAKLIHFPMYFTLHLPQIQIGKSTHFREKNISMKTNEFIISIGKISKNVINILCNSQYPRLPVNGESSNTFGLLELLFPISKMDRSCFVPTSKKDRSCYVPKSIVLVSFPKDLLFLASLWLV